MTSLLTNKEAASLLRVSTRTLFERTVPRGPIPCVRIGRRVLYDAAAIKAWVDAQQPQRQTEKG